MMRKMTLLTIALFVSIHCYADNGSKSLGTTIINGFQKQENAKTDALSMVYGGHDFRDADVAIANTSVLSGQASTIG